MDFFVVAIQNVGRDFPIGFMASYFEKIQGNMFHFFLARRNGPIHSFRLHQNVSFSVCECELHCGISVWKSPEVERQSSSEVNDGTENYVEHKLCNKS